jgi:hypothetical protein
LHLRGFFLIINFVCAGHPKIDSDPDIDDSIVPAAGAAHVRYCFLHMSTSSSSSSTSSCLSGTGLYLFIYLFIYLFVYLIIYFCITVCCHHMYDIVGVMGLDESAKCAIYCDACRCRCR